MIELGQRQREGRCEESWGSRRGEKRRRCRSIPADRQGERESQLPFLGLPHFRRVSDP